MKKHFGFILNLAAIALFVPGIMLPIFSLAMEVTANVGSGSLSSDIVNKELSLIGTIDELWQDQRFLVATLIFAFSIAIPVLKTVLVTTSYFIKNNQTAKKLVGFVNIIGKWSMADVFIVAIFLAVLSTNHAETATEQQISMFAFKLNVLISSETLSNIGQGFYYFTGYCLLSILGTQLLQSALTKPQKNIHQASAES
ncbi:MAG: paraquat-inducible protein A [Thalassotalea sp.]